MPLYMEHVPLYVEHLSFYVKHMSFHVEHMSVYMEHMSFYVEHMSFHVEYLPFYVDHICQLTLKVFVANYVLLLLMSTHSLLTAPAPNTEFFYSSQMTWLDFTEYGLHDQINLIHRFSTEILIGIVWLRLVKTTHV